MEGTIIFTDGASKGNPGPGGFGAIIVSGKDVVEVGSGEASTTNNRMEIAAVIAALEYISRESEAHKKITIFTDSSYVLRGATKWIEGWQEAGWVTKGKKQVLNRDLWERLADLTKGQNIEWKLLSGHVGIAGNERADEIATAFAGAAEPKLFSGPAKEYKIDILNITHDTKKKHTKKKDKAHSRAKAYSYVSMVNGKIETHQTWAECEKRVKGVSGAKFKKAKSVEEERGIIGEWKGTKKVA